MPPLGYLLHWWQRWLKLNSACRHASQPVFKSCSVSRSSSGKYFRLYLFNVYLRDLPRLAETAGSKLLMFADDKTVYSSDPSKARSEAKLSSALEILNNHLGSLGMQINTDKTVVIQIHSKRATGSQQQH